MALTPLDFPPSPTVGTLYPDPPVTGQPTYRWDGAQWLSYAAASLPTPTKPNNYGKKNYIINGAMMVSQENGTTIGTTTAYYPVDQFVTAMIHGGVASVLKYDLAGGAAYTPGGSPSRLRVVASSQDNVVGPTDLFYIYQAIEGSRIADLKSGTASAKVVTLQFGVRAPAGTYCVSIRNGDNTRSYVAEYVISAGQANTETLQSITFTLDTTGTWATDASAGMRIGWMLMAGGNYFGSLGWQAAGAGPVLATTSQTNFMNVTNNVFELFDVSLTEGSVAPPFQVPDYASELALCQRYWQFGFVAWDGWITAGQTLVSMMVDFKVTMRSTPSVFFINGVATGVAAAATAPQILVDGMEVRHTTAAAGVAAFMDTWKVSARL